MPILANSRGVGDVTGVWNSPVTKDYAIEGKMVVVEDRYDSLDQTKLGLDVDDDILKKRLMTALAYKLWESGHVEFTKQKDILTDELVIRARVFVTPDSQTRILRTVQK